jgi:hypothetical protein
MAVGEHVSKLEGRESFAEGVKRSRSRARCELAVSLHAGESALQFVEGGGRGWTHLGCDVGGDLDVLNANGEERRMLDREASKDEGGSDQVGGWVAARG